jgi:hypothetical protein
VLEEGDPTAAIMEKARTFSCDLIVMGTHGRTGVVPAPVGQRGRGRPALRPLSCSDRACLPRGRRAGWNHRSRSGHDVLKPGMQS